MTAPPSEPGTETIILDTPRRPRVSVVIPVFGRADLTLQAVAHLVANTPPVFELILVDNCSPDRSFERVRASVRGAVTVMNDINCGFSAAVNVGVMHAKAEFVLIMNSDVFVEPGWLPPLLTALDANASMAAVSPLLLNMDGTVQEAGSIIFHDATTAPIDRGDQWALDFPRTVPYCSAACLLIRRSVLSLIGGLDVAYVEGYYEDVDLALDLESRGLSIGFVPASHARHVRNGSTWPERAIMLGLRNKELFRHRWSSRLAGLPAHESDPVAQLLRGRDAFAVDRLLIIDDRVPHVDRGSGDPRMASICTTLARLWPDVRVTVLAANLVLAQRYAPLLLAAGVEIADASLETAEQWLQSRAGHYSAVLVSRPHNFVAFRNLIDQTQPQAIRIVDVEALFSRRTQLQADTYEFDRPDQADELRRRAAHERSIEVESWHWASVITCVSTEEASEVERIAPHARVIVVAGTTESPETVADFDQRSGAVFFGGFMAGESSPNVDTVHHLLDRIMPLLWQRLPSLELTIAGADPTPSVVARAARRVTVRGAVRSPGDVLDTHRLHLVPMRFGAGVKTKMVESMHFGIPFVASGVGAEGLQLGSIRDRLVAEDPLQFTNLAEALLTDRDLWYDTQDGLRRIAARHFSQQALVDALISLCAEIGIAPPSAARLDRYVPRTDSLARFVG